MKPIQNKPTQEKSKPDKSNVSKKFFIVDDDEYFNQLLKVYIHKIGREINLPVKTSNFLNGSDCLNDIQEEPDFVILDFYLDENNDITLTGYDVLAKITKYNRNIKVIVISQMHEWENFKEDFIQFGATDFLKKDSELYNNLKDIVQHHCSCDFMLNLSIK